MRSARELASEFLMIIGRSFAQAAIPFGAPINPRLLLPPQRAEAEGHQTRTGEPR
jgi:hypothetical protein